MYLVYQNQGPITLQVISLDRFNNLPLMKKITLVSRTVRVKKFKPDTHMDSGLMYCVYRYQGQGPITLGVTSVDMFYNLPIMKFFRYIFLRNYVSCKAETWYTYRQCTDASFILESGLRAYAS